MTKKSKRAKHSEMVIPLRRPYVDLVLVLLMFGSAAAFFFFRAQANDRGLILNGIIEFGPDGADVFYAIMGILSMAFCGTGLFGAWRISQVKDFRILLGKTKMRFPAAPVYKTAEVIVPFARIVAVETPLTGAQASLVIREDKKAHVIPHRWLDKQWNTQEIAEMVISRAREAQKDV